MKRPIAICIVAACLASVSGLEAKQAPELRRGDRKVAVEKPQEKIRKKMPAEKPELRGKAEHERKMESPRKPEDKGAAKMGQQPPARQAAAAQREEMARHAKEMTARIEAKVRREMLLEQRKDAEATRRLASDFLKSAERKVAGIDREIAAIEKMRKNWQEADRKRAAAAMERKKREAMARERAEFARVKDELHKVTRELRQMHQEMDALRAKAEVKPETKKPAAPKVKQGAAKGAKKLKQDGKKDGKKEGKKP
ncbi:MAG: hypothetical protein ACQCXQ_06145 [Verrucomicrobiales bacterium]|nr:hypothetical protein [Verrucomicrobiota bacterium JB025]